MIRRSGNTNINLLILLASVGLFYFFIQFGSTSFKDEHQENFTSNFRAKLSPDLAQLSDEDSIRSAESRKRLAESIISVVRNYYVDADRVENTQLLEMTLKTLSYSPEIETDFGANEFSIKIGSRKEEFSIPTPLRKEVLAEIFSDLGSILDNYGPKDLSFAFDEKAETNGISRVINAMLFALDAHSSLLSPTAYRELRQGTEGTFGGLGLLVGMRDRLLTVIKPLPKSPALRAGIKKHDKILSINGVQTFGYSLDEMVEYMKGDPGTKVKLLILRDGEMGPVDMALTREIINVDSVTPKKITKNIADTQINILVLEIDSFAARTSREVLTAIRAEQSRLKGALHGVVLDLRSNPGGLLDQAVETADLFLKSGVIVATKGRKEEIENAILNRDEIDFPIAVLINSDSASASEIVAGALQDNNRAVVIGQPSFGKGSVQTIFELPAERALKLTIARYYTPRGRSIQNVGIMPDVWLQPVEKSEVNENLLGLYRYQNEGSLENHLENAVSEDISSWDDPEETFPHALDNLKQQPSLKSYYLVEDANKEKQRERVDHELEMAIQIMGLVGKTYKGQIPEGARRASHWLALAAPEIKRKLGSFDKEVGRWLNTKHKLDWSKGPRMPHIELDLEVSSANEEDVVAGDKVPVFWKVTNNDPISSSRLSVFVRSYLRGFDTEETLIGKLNSGESKSGQVLLKIPSTAAHGNVTFWFGLATEGEPLRTISKPLHFKVKDKTNADLVAETKLFNESVLKNNSIEKQESAYIEVSIKNKGSIDAHNLSINLVNLGGKQVDIESEIKKIELIKPGETKAVQIKIKGAQKIVSQQIPLGLAIESETLNEPLYKNISVAGSVNEYKESGKDIAH